jgi:hypothetical protein
MNMRASATMLVLLALVAASGCRSRLFGRSSSIVVLNESQGSLTVFVVGSEALTVRHGFTRMIASMGSGRHVPEAKDGVGRRVERRHIELRGGQDYYWRIESCPPR